MLIAWLIRLGIPKRYGNAAAWAVLIVGGLLLLWGAKTLYDRSVVKRHEAKQLERSIPAINRAAEDRANDALLNALSEREREEAIERAATAEAALPSEERATLPPTTVALNCARLKAYPALRKTDAYKEKCL